MKLHHAIAAAMVLGIGVGLSLNFASHNGYIERDLALQIGWGGEFLGHVFLTLLQMVVVPLVFASIVTAIVGVGERGLGRLGLYTVGYYMLTSCMAVITGLLVVSVIRPGAGMDYNTLLEAANAELQVRGIEVEPPKQHTLFGVVSDITTRVVPENPIAAATSNSRILGVVFFAVLFSVFTVRSGGKTQQIIGDFFKAVFDVMSNMVNAILWLAPVGIFGYLVFVCASTGVALAAQLSWYLIAVFAGLIIHGAITLPLLLHFVAERNPLTYAMHLEDALTTAFSTASSAGTLPVTLEGVRSAGVPDGVASFTLPLGATVNMDGTALYEVVAVLFVAQMMPGFELTSAAQLGIAITALAVSVGAAGIPHAGTVMMVVVFDAAGLDSEAVLVLLAVDRVADMARTSVNVWSDAVGAAVISKVARDGPWGS